MLYSDHSLLTLECGENPSDSVVSETLRPAHLSPTAMLQVSYLLVFNMFPLTNALCCCHMIDWLADSLIEQLYLKTIAACYPACVKCFDTVSLITHQVCNQSQNVLLHMRRWYCFMLSISVCCWMTEKPLHEMYACVLLIYKDFSTRQF